MDYCAYYQAHVDPAHCWFLVGILRSCEYMVFDRTLDKVASIVEFFVPQDIEQDFLQMMEVMIERGIMANLQKLPNRLAQPGATL